MAAKDEKCDDNGIEANDLASLLYRFEEATSSVSDLKLCLKKKRDKFMQVWGPGSTVQDSSLLSDMVSGSSGVAYEKKMYNTQNSVSVLLTDDLSANSNSIEPPFLHSESLDKASDLSHFKTESQLVPLQVERSETNVDSQLLAQVTTSHSAKIMKQTENSLVLWPEEVDSSSNLLTKTSVLQDTVAKRDNLISVYLRESSVALTSPVESSFVPPTSEICTKYPLPATICAMEDNYISKSRRSIQLLQLHKNPILSDSTTSEDFERIVQTKSNFTDGLSLYCECSANLENQSSQPISNYSKDNDNFYELELDHSYCSNNLKTAKTEFVEESASSISCTSFRTITQQEKPLAIDNVGLYQDITDVLYDDQFVSNSINTEDFIFEEREIFVDTDGNELYSLDACQQFNTLKSEYSEFSHEATVRATDKKGNRKRLHSEYSMGTFHDEKSVFFDKIPSYYTALSIPSKPVTTTVFASTTKAIGTTDHLDLLDVTGPFDEGHYDKVPAHRRCFTNTTKEVEIKFEDQEVQNSARNIPTQSYFQKYTSHEINSLCLPLQSGQSCVGNLTTDSKHTSNTSSEIPARRSRSTKRRSSSASRFSRHSASSMSDCSTCSSCSNSSACSTCSLSSRSPSSSGSDTGSSRSRSPGSKSSIVYQDKRARQHLASSKVRQSRSRTRSPCEDPGWRSKRHTYRNKQNFTMEERSGKRKMKEEEQAKAMEERRIVYVGKIPDGYTKRQLYQRFQSFGEIREVKVNFREHGDNYGFVTFAYACDAIAAKEKGNSLPGEVKFDLCFGGRRHFCPDQYSDLDGNREIEEEYAPMPRNLTQGLDYAALLKLHSTHQKKL